MSIPRDDGSSAKGPAGEPSGTPDAAQPRKPRIEVLRPASATPAHGPAQGSDQTSMGSSGGASPDAPPTQPARIEPDRRQRADALPARQRKGLFPSRMLSLLLIAAILIAGLLLYTYAVNKRDAAAYVAERTTSSSATTEMSENSQVGSDVAGNREPAAPPMATRVEEILPEPAAEASPASDRSAARDTRQAAVDDASDEAAIADDAVSDENGGAPAAVLAFYSALSAGDGAAAAQMVIPEKRQRGPLSAGALGRYYSSFRRPLRVRSVAKVDAKTTRVAYDYVLADGRLCRGEAAVEVAQRDGRSLVSRIRTRGPC